MELYVFRDLYDPKDLAELKELLLIRHNGQFGSFWLKNEYEWLALHINNEKANLTLTGANLKDDPLLSRNLDFTGTEDDTVDFVIDNYQLDNFPADTVIPLAIAQAAFEEYFLTGELSKSIDWR